MPPFLELLLGTQFSIWLIYDYIKTVVEASNQGRHLYESEGFKFLERYIAPLPEKWAGRNRQEFNWMVRPAKKKEIKPQQ